MFLHVLDSIDNHFQYIFEIDVDSILVIFLLLGLVYVINDFLIAKNPVIRRTKTFSKLSYCVLDNI